jgi:hypothetical protein
MRSRSRLILFGSFLAIICGLGTAHAQSATPGFTISASNATIPNSGTVAIPFTVTSVNGFAGSVVVTCGPANQPTGSILPLCGNGVVVVPYTLPANGTVTGSLDLVSYIPPCNNACPVKFVSPRPRGAVNLALGGGPQSPRRRGAASLAVAGVVLLGFGFRRKARQLRLLLLVVGIMAGLSGIGCGSGNHSTLTPGTFAYTISAVEVTTDNPSLVVNTTVNVTIPAGISTDLPSANP